jgi:hypothetical protein
MADYGIWLERDLDLEASAADVDREALLDAQTTTLAQHNADIAAWGGIFGDFTTKNQASVKTGAGNVRLQPLDEFGRPRPIKGRGFYYVGFPLWKGGTAQGYTFWAAAQMTVQDYADGFNTMLEADVTWVRDQYLAPFFYNGAGFTYADPLQNENVTVYGMANGDTVTYDKSTGAATDDHYSAQANALGAGADNPMDAIYTELIEHPLNDGSRIVAFINPAQQAAMEALAGFAPLNRLIIEPVLAAGSATTDPLFSPSLNLPLSRAMTHIGTHGSTSVVVWNHMPANYMLTVAVDSQVKPLGVRQYPQPALQGLINQGEPMSRFPYQQDLWVRALGTGAKNRTAAHLHRFGNGTWAAPTGYTFPVS